MINRYQFYQSVLEEKHLPPPPPKKTFRPDNGSHILGNDGYSHKEFIKKYIQQAILYIFGFIIA